MSKTKIESRCEPLDDDTCLYRLEGMLSGSTDSYRFQDEVREKIGSGTKMILVDLSGVKRIDSSGVGILVAIMWSASSAGGGG